MLVAGIIMQVSAGSLKLASTLDVKALIEVVLPLSYTMISHQ